MNRSKQQTPTVLSFQLTWAIEFLRIINIIAEVSHCAIKSFENKVRLGQRWKHLKKSIWSQAFVFSTESFKITNTKQHSVITFMLIKAFQGNNITESKFDVYSTKAKWNVKGWQQSYLMLFALSVTLIVYTVYSENFKTKANSVPLQTPWTAKCSLHSLLASYVARRD